MKMNTMDWIAFVLVVIGSVNWGLIGLFQYDLVSVIFGGMDGTLTRIVFALVGLASLWMIGSAAVKSGE